MGSVVGVTVGVAVVDGLNVEVGRNVGVAVVGLRVGDVVGKAVVGFVVGVDVDGEDVGVTEGTVVGDFVGAKVEGM